MSEIWAERQRRTNALVRIIAGRVLASEPSSAQIFGLCKLTWITTSYDGDEPAYIKSTKIPAISDAMGIDFRGKALAVVANSVAHEFQDNSLEQLILSHTGFTDFYKAYRNSAPDWIEANKIEVISIIRKAYSLSSDEEGALLADRIDNLPRIPMANHPEKGMDPNSIMSPVCFSLDPRLRFPIINGAVRVQALLSKMRIANGTAVQKYRALVGLIGHSGIKDAADLDQWWETDYFEDILSSEPDRLHYLLEAKPETGNELPSKDESEVEILQEAISIEHRRIHNKMTNQLRHILANRTLLEGRKLDCKYDVLVLNYDGEGNKLLIEAKSSTDASQVRMAIGQLYDYWYKLKSRYKLKSPEEEMHCAAMFPSQPSIETQKLLSWLDIGTLWIDSEHLYTSTDWLASVATLVKTS